MHLFSAVLVFSAVSLSDVSVVWNPKTGFSPQGRAWTAAGLADLTNALSKVTGRVARVYAEAECPDGLANAIYYGDTAAAREAGCAADPLRRGDWRLKVTADAAYLYAKGGTGAAFAATDFLERWCGYHFLTAEGDDPYTVDPALRLPIADVTVRPALYKRSVYTSRYGMWSDYARRRRIGELDEELEGEYRVSYNVKDVKGATRLCHTSFSYLPPEKYFKDHPDWYAKLAGVRKASSEYPFGQLCLSNPEMREEALRRLLEIIATDRREFPTDYPTVYDFTQQDCSDTMCECAACRKIAAKYNRVPGGWTEGGDAGLQLEFINHLAREARKHYPDVQLRTFAYMSTECPPKPGTIRPEPNVNIWWCDCYSLSDHMRRLDGGTDFNALQAKRVAEWLKLTDNVTVWDYMLYGGFDGTPDMPEWSGDAIAADAKFFRDCGLVRMSMESEALDLLQPFYELNFFLMSRFHIDPETDLDAAVKTYCRVYGAAADEMQAALSMLRGWIAADRPADSVAWHSRMLAWRTVPNWESFRKKVEAAYAKCDRASGKFRIVRVLASVNRELARLYSQATGRDAELEQAKAAAVSYGRRFVEGAPWLAAEDRERIIDRMTMSVNALGIRFDDLPSEVAGAPADAIKCADGRFIGEGTPHAQWLKDPETKSEKVRVWKYGRTDAEHPGFPIPCGVYDFPTKEAFSFSIARDSAPFADEKYHWVKLGRAHLGRNTITWMPADWHLGFQLKEFFTDCDATGTDRNWYDIWISLKFTGPAYFPGSTKPNGIWHDRLVLRRVD